MGIQIEFLGAAGNVTGSRALIRFEGKRYLVDCGLFQGTQELRLRNWTPFLHDAATLDGVFLTHAHLDHAGYLPKLRKEGFRGPIHCTAGTRDLAEVLLRDAGHLQEEDAAFANRTGHSRHRPALPLFTERDADAVSRQLVPHPRDEWIRIDPNLGVRFLRSGHIVGSSLIQFSFGTGQSSFLVTFSGDVGHQDSRILRGPVHPPETDVLVLESTYGNRRHGARNALDELATVARRTFERGGVLVIPAFAVGRAQEITYAFRQLEDAGRIPRVPVILDSPMSITATDIFLRHTEDHVLPATFAAESKNFYPHRFEATASQDDSMMACMRDGPMVVISASGMLAGGRILHHLKHRLPSEKNTLLFAGEQAEGTKGRFLLDHGRERGSVRIHHEEIPVNAEIARIDSLSAHADSAELLDWLGHLPRAPKQIILNHGSVEASAAFARQIRARFGWAVTPLAREQSFHFESDPA